MSAIGESGDRDVATGETGHVELAAEGSGPRVMAPGEPGAAEETGVAGEARPADVPRMTLFVSAEVQDLSREDILAMLDHSRLNEVPLDASNHFAKPVQDLAQKAAEAKDVATQYFAHDQGVLAQIRANHQELEQAQIGPRTPKDLLTFAQLDRMVKYQEAHIALAEKWKNLAVLEDADCAKALEVWVKVFKHNWNLYEDKDGGTVSLEMKEDRTEWEASLAEFQALQRRIRFLSTKSGEARDAFAAHQFV